MEAARRFPSRGIPVRPATVPIRCQPGAARPGLPGGIPHAPRAVPTNPRLRTDKSAWPRLGGRSAVLLEPVVLEVSEEHNPRGRSETQVAQVAVLGVADQDRTGGLGDLDAVASRVTAVTGLAPGDSHLDTGARVTAVAGLAPVKP